MYEQNSVYSMPVPKKNPNIQPPYYEIIVPLPKPEIVPDDDSDSLTFEIKRKKKDPANKKRPWDTPPFQLEETLELLN